MGSGGKIIIAADNRSIAPGEVAELAPGDYLVLAVIDTGSGIATEHLEKVLEPFFTTKEVGKGTGLGLSMVYGFATQSNGAFQLHSKLGKGTRAEIFLPRALVANEHASNLVEEPEELSAMRPLNILLVDDHDEVRATTAAVLEELGHTVTQATNGPDALAALEDGATGWDLLISDYAMPELSGTELVARLRQVHPDLPCIIITGYAEGEAVGERPDDVMVLPKPFTPARLSKAILKVI
jgi:CheY-like chemotaxis protein